MLSVHLGETKAISLLLQKVLKEAKSIRHITLAGDFSEPEKGQVGFRMFKISHKFLQKIRLTHIGLSKNKIAEISFKKSQQLFEVCLDRFLCL